jgi:2-aminoadipate transaminase
LSLQWNRVIASRTAKLAPSPFDAVEAIRDIPGLIYFAGGAPPIEMLPVHRLRQAIADAWENPGSVLFYDETPGYPGLLDAIAERMARRGAPVDPARLMVTNGSQQGIDLIARTLFDPGDVVVVEGPTYFGAMQAFDGFEVCYRTVEIDSEGLIIEQLEAAFQATPTPKALYTVPTFQNPTGITISIERRKKIIELSKQYNVPIIEDDPYGELHFPGNETGPMFAMDDQIIYLGTFSKTLAPSLRMGWMVMPEPLIPALVNSKEGVDIQSDRVLQRAIVSTIADGWLDQHLEEARHLYAARCQRMIDALSREMPSGTRWITPGGGFFVWVLLPDGLPADELLPIAGEHKVAFFPGSAFYPDRRQEPALRLGFSTLPEADIDEGIRRLGQATEEALVRTGRR